jgi:hypothetical protein
MDLELRKKLVKCYIWSRAPYGAETWTLWGVDQKHLESFEMWCWGRMEKISWTNDVRNEEVPYILESNLHSIFGDFLNGKKLVRGSNLHFSFNCPLPTG